MPRISNFENISKWWTTVILKFQYIFHHSISAKYNPILMKFRMLTETVCRDINETYLIKT